MINVVMVGRIATVGEVREKNNLKYCSFSLVSDHYSKANGGYTPDFLNAIIFGKRAEALCWEKGALVEVTGVLESSAGKKDPKQTFWTLKVNSLIFLKKAKQESSGKGPVTPREPEDDDYPF